MAILPTPRSQPCEPRQKAAPLFVLAMDWITRQALAEQILELADAAVSGLRS